MKPQPHQDRSRETYRPFVRQQASKWLSRNPRPSGHSFDDLIATALLEVDEVRGRFDASKGSWLNFVAIVSRRRWDRIGSLARCREASGGGFELPDQRAEHDTRGRSYGRNPASLAIESERAILIRRAVKEVIDELKHKGQLDSLAEFRKFGLRVTAGTKPRHRPRVVKKMLKFPSVKRLRKLYDDVRRGDV